MKSAHHDAFARGRGVGRGEWERVNLRTPGHSGQSRCAERLRGQAELRSARYRAMAQDRVVPMPHDDGAVIDLRGKEGEGVLGDDDPRATIGATTPSLSD